MFRRFLFVILTVLNCSGFDLQNHNALQSQTNVDVISIDSISSNRKMKLALQQEFELTKDPVTNTIPHQRLIAAFNYSQSFAKNQANKTSAAIAGIKWKERGPNNIGGRTRAIMIDPNDLTKKTVWAGSVSGGLWKTTDITAASPNWIPANDLMANLAVTCIVSDPANSQIMYFATGEGFSNPDAVQGLGIWKSTNGGATWNQLASTTSATFRFIKRLVVASNGNIYAATLAGLQRSQNGGLTWTKVLGPGTGTGTTNSIGDIEISNNGTFFCGAGLLGATDGVYKSSTGNAGAWTKCNTGTNGFPTTGIQRIKLACAPSNANVVYAMCQGAGNGIGAIYKSVDAGVNWITCALPTDADPVIGADFTHGQAWYDLAIAVDPNNANTLIVGGINLFKSSNAGSSWTQITHWNGGFGFQNVHSNQHLVIYEPGNSSVIYFGNDGGVWISNNGIAAAPTIISKNFNYNVTQFYAGALNPDFHSNQMMSGAQDNGTNQTNNPLIGSAIQVTGGDGGFCHIDQNQPQFQFASGDFNNYFRSTNTGTTFSSITSNSSGSFINPTDYDDANNNLYACHNNGDYYVMLNAPVSATLTAIAVAAFGGGKVTHINVSPNTANRVFFGLSNGNIVRVDNAHTGTPSATNIRVAAMPTTPVSCIAVQSGNDLHLLATYSNYGVNSVWETTNGGTTWVSVEGNLPDMPIRWALFSPNSDMALLATELGVWSTDNLNGGATVWGPSNNGLANVRVDMLQMRNSDSLVMAATHGRGNYTTDFFMTASPDFTSDKIIAYLNKPVNYIDLSYNASSWSWDFGDGTFSVSQNPTKFYATPGLYNVTLTINGNRSITKTSYIQILPNRGTPYTPANGGNFEINPLDFGADNISGTQWQRGNSATAGKNGVFSGSNVWVTGLSGNYGNNTDARLLSPNFNMAAPGVYTLKLYRKNSFEIGKDGMRLEYSLDKGDSWLPLATTTSAGWYDFANNAVATSFPINQAYFNNLQSSFLLCQYDISAFAGNNNVAFRLRFKSDEATTQAGIAIDDFEIVGVPNVPLPVELLSFTAKPIDNNKVVCKWATASETTNDFFTVEKSTDAISFTTTGKIDGAGYSSVITNYSFTDEHPYNGVSYYRLKQTDFNGAFTYSQTAAVQFKTTSNLSVYPLLTTGEVFIASPTKLQNATATVMNSEGKIIAAYLLNADGGEQQISLGEQSNGLYFVIVTTATERQIFKVVKQ